MFSIECNARARRVAATLSVSRVIRESYIAAAHLAEDDEEEALPEREEGEDHAQVPGIVQPQHDQLLPPSRRGLHRFLGLTSESRLTPGDSVSQHANSRETG